MATLRFKSTPPDPRAVATYGSTLVSPQVVQRLVSSFAPDRIVLFGSRARGLARPDSDIDLLLVGTWSMEPAQLLRHARHLVAGSVPRVDLVFCTPSEIEAAQSGYFRFLSSILGTGVTIYSR